jgi:hypothetical protein
LRGYFAIALISVKITLQWEAITEYQWEKLLYALEFRTATQSRQDFLNEALKLVRCQHPHVVRVMDSGVLRSLV